MLLLNKFFHGKTQRKTARGVTATGSFSFLFDRKLQQNV
jgi:hypothetical protein